MSFDVLRLLVVCTANQCRSPMGEVIARAMLDERGIPSRVTSAGTHALDGTKATDGAEMTARRLGLDLSAHQSRPVTAELVADADLVVAMERRHVVDLVIEYSAPFVSVYTLPELAQLAAPSLRQAEEGLADWLVRISHDRDPASSLRAPEIADPIGRSMRRYRKAGRQISDAFATLFDAYEGGRQDR